jgi:hypothetical protein
MSGVAAYPEPADYVFDEERCLELASDTEQARAAQFEDFGRCSLSAHSARHIGGFVGLGAARLRRHLLPRSRLLWSPMR